MDDFADIARLIGALRPWLAHLVIVGGWAHRLHRFHPLANPPAQVIAAYMYDIELLPGSHECHDGRCRSTGVHVQLKGTQRNRVAMYGETDHLIVLRITTGRAEEIYNGPGLLPWAEAGPVAKNGQRIISLAKLRSLAQDVSPDRRLPLVRAIED